ncbi:RBR-type E3 ubiquitin transferase [Mycena kentingensis (nom. inval.)]|nr:RBR-type E3 ubiquitin transferase [Mycena kentingensis (nom. inval.)]
MSTLIDATVDAATAALISKLILEDVGELQNISFGKGKRSESARPTNEEYALRAFAEEAQYLQDLVLALSIDHALELDQPVLAVLSTVEEGAHDDRRYAQALQDQQPLPQQSEVQRLMEDPDFAALSRDVADADTVPDHDSGSDDTAVEHAQPSSSSTIVVRPAKATRKRLVCVICRESIPSRYPVPFESICGHSYCNDCITNLVRSCIGDETLFPLQCCRQPMPMDGLRGVFAQLTPRLAAEFRVKASEFGTPAAERIYCPGATCSAFLGSTTTQTSQNAHCPRCYTSVCVSCKERAHPNERCGENLALEAVKALARAEGWQTCPNPGCGRIIELHHGCYHMTCPAPCRTQFCYLCAALWKNCQCVQWEEQRLIDTAQQRVENEMGARARAVAPDIFQQRVQQRVERLRYEHDCAAGHRWRRRNGGAVCQECSHFLREYLLLCRGCGIAATVSVASQFDLARAAATLMASPRSATDLALIRGLTHEQRKGFMKYKLTEQYIRANARDLLENDEWIDMPSLRKFLDEADPQNALRAAAANREPHSSSSEPGPRVRVKDEERPIRRLSGPQSSEVIEVLTDSEDEAAVVPSNRGRGKATSPIFPSPPSFTGRVITVRAPKHSLSPPVRSKKNYNVGRTEFRTYILDQLHACIQAQHPSWSLNKIRVKYPQMYWTRWPAIAKEFSMRILNWPDKDGFPGVPGKDYNVGSMPSSVLRMLAAAIDGKGKKDILPTIQPWPSKDNSRTFSRIPIVVAADGEVLLFADGSRPMTTRNGANSSGKRPRRMSTDSEEADTSGDERGPEPKFEGERKPLPRKKARLSSPVASGSRDVYYKSSFHNKI